MRKSITYLSILFCFQLLLSQESEIEIVKPKSSSSDLNEPYLKYYDNGTIRISGQKNKGVRIGEWKNYFDNGQVSHIYSYTKGKRNISQEKFYKSGSIRSVIGGNKEKSYEMEYYETGELFVERQIKTGNFKEYYKNGKLKVDTNYVKHHLSGLWTGFSETGQKEWEVNYLDGYLSGGYKQFYKNGKIKVEGKYNKNKKQGKEKHFTEDGILDWEGVYDKGIPIKKWKKYNIEGKVVANNVFKKGVLIKNNKNFKTEGVFIPKGIIKVPPIYPGCEGALGTLGKMKCTNSKITQLVVHFFNKDLDIGGPNLSGFQKINLFFKVDKKGEVGSVIVRTPHKALIEETKKIASYIPSMIPATIRGKKVSFRFRLPIRYLIK